MTSTSAKRKTAGRWQAFLAYLAFLPFALTFHATPAFPLETRIDLWAGHDNNPGLSSDRQPSAYIAGGVDVGHTIYLPFGVEDRFRISASYTDYLDTGDNWRAATGMELSRGLLRGLLVPSLDLSMGLYRDQLVREDERNQGSVALSLDMVLDSATMGLGYSWTWLDYRHGEEALAGTTRPFGTGMGSLGGEGGSFSHITISRAMEARHMMGPGGDHGDRMPGQGQMGHEMYRSGQVSEPRDDRYEKASVRIIGIMPWGMKARFGVDRSRLFSSLALESFKGWRIAADLVVPAPLGAYVTIHGSWTRRKYENSPGEDRKEYTRDLGMEITKRLPLFILGLRLEFLDNDSEIPGEAYSRTTWGIGLSRAF